jgi:transcriptional regulator with XRE-family HTH domain
MKKGEKLKELIAKKGINIETFAANIGVSTSSVFKYYNKEHFDSELLEKFCSELDVPITIFFDDNIMHQTSTGNSNVLVGRDNNGSISTKQCQDQLDDALCEIKHLKDEISGKDKLIHEKERLIDVLMNMGSSKNVDMSIIVYATTGSVKIDILQITNITPCTGQEKEFVSKINSGSGHEYPCCIIHLGKETLPVLQDPEYVWSLIIEKLTYILKG